MKIVETEIILITSIIILVYNFIAGSENITTGKRKRDVQTTPVGDLVDFLIHATHWREGDTTEESQRAVRICQDHMLEASILPSEAKKNNMSKKPKKFVCLPNALLTLERSSMNLTNYYYR